MAHRRDERARHCRAAALPRAGRTIERERDRRHSRTIAHGHPLVRGLDRPCEPRLTDHDEARGRRCRAIRAVSAQESGHENADRRRHAGCVGGSSVRNDQLRAPGTITLHHLELADTGDPLDTFMSIPTKAAVAALKRRHDDITLHFVLAGNLHDPKFSLNENLMTKMGSGFASARRERRGRGERRGRNGEGAGRRADESARAVMPLPSRQSRHVTYAACVKARLRWAGRGRAASRRSRRCWCDARRASRVPWRLARS